MIFLRSLLLLTIALGCCALDLKAQKKRLTIDDVLGGIFYAGFPPFEWSQDGSRLEIRQGGQLLFLNPRDGMVKLAPSKDDARAVRTREMAKALGGLDLAAGEATAVAGRAEPKGAKAMVGMSGGDLYFHRKSEKARRLTTDGVEKHEVELSPDGSRVAFVRGNDLHVIETSSGKAAAITDDGGEDVFNGRLDWVYQEEVYGRGKFKGFWWSPKSSHIAYLRIDQKGVKEFTVVDFIPDESLQEERAVRPEVSHYPKAGDPNPAAKLGVVNLEDGRTVWMDLGDYDPDILIVRVGWNLDGTKVVFQVQNRIQTWLDLNYGDLETGAVTRILREQAGDHGWVNVIEEPRWLGDGSMLWLSERTGYKHLYHHDAGGGLRRAVTDGTWAVGEILKVDESSGKVWLTATKDGAINKNVYRVGLDGTGMIRLTEGSGTHKVHLNADGSHFVDAFSSLQTPFELRLCKGDGTVERVLRRPSPPALKTHEFGYRELVEIPTRDGFLMDATVLKPTDFDENDIYPVFLDIYGGPDTPIVRNTWNAGASPFHQFLAQQGVIVLQVNNRTASGKGQVYTSQCYKNFGACEFRDLEDAVDWFCRNSWADASRVAISGWSYGGTMAAYALTHSKKFAVGFAGAGVYDWRLYDTIYTERYMDTPQRNPSGYASSSVIGSAKNLHGHLVILHGTKDDNVHLQNAMQLSYALQKAGKQFELMLYPQSRHRVGTAQQMMHMRKLIWGVLKDRLLTHR